MHHNSFLLAKGKGPTNGGIGPKHDSDSRKMAGKITSLSFQKRTSDRVNVYLDGEFAFGLPVLEATKLKVGQELGDADIADLLASDVAQRAYDRAVRFLSYRPRSVWEVIRNLIRAGVDESLIEAVIERLTHQGYLNDAEFARFWVGDRQRFRPKGARALRQELRQKGVSDAVIDETLVDLDPMASALAAGRPRALRLASLAEADPFTFRRKLSGFLLRRGFDYGIVREVVTCLAEEMAADLADEDVDE